MSPYEAMASCTILCTLLHNAKPLTLGCHAGMSKADEATEPIDSKVATASAAFAASCRSFLQHRHTLARDAVSPKMLCALSLMSVLQKRNEGAFSITPIHL